MKVNKIGSDLIKKYEGCRLSPYLCSAGVPTIGYGCTIYPEGTAVSLDDKSITLQKAESLFAHDLITFENAVERCLAGTPVNENQFSALVSFTYNLGERRLQKSTLLKLIKLGKMSEAANEFEKWCRAGDKVLQGLKNRRLAEKELFLKG